MGNSASVSSTDIAPPLRHTLISLKKSDEEIVKTMMPSYYCLDPLTNEEIEMALKTWMCIVDDQCPNFADLKAKGLVTVPCCEGWFNKLFYERLFDIYPRCRPMFTNTESPNHALVSFISFIFSTVGDHSQFQSRLYRLVESHHKRHVIPHEYFIIGEVLFWTLNHVLTDELYGPAQLPWEKIFSQMLSIIIPYSIAMELEGVRAPSQSSFMGRFDSSRAFAMHSHQPSAEFESEPVPPQ